MRLGELLEGVARRNAKSAGVGPAREITAVAYDSRKVTPGALFVAIRGEHADGNQFVGDALSRGATVVVSGQPRPAAGVAPEVDWVQVEEPRQALARIAANFCGRPANALELVGITGTNG